MPPHGWVGLAIIAAAEALLLAGHPVVSRWFTPTAWTGYVLLIDAAVARRTGHSYLTSARAELVLVALASIVCWWLFEGYNAPRFWRGGADRVGLWWQYHGLEPDPWLRRIGYDWSFATIFPALFLTAVFLRATLFRRVPVRVRRPPPALLNVSMALGGRRAATARGGKPVARPARVDGLHPAAGADQLPVRPALLAGRPRRGRRLAAAGAARLRPRLRRALGVLELLGGDKWTYTVPFAGDVKIFEMPMLGYLGFPPFALECYAMYHWLRGALGRLPAPLV